VLLVQDISLAVVVLVLLTIMLVEREALEVVARLAVRLEQMEWILLEAVAVEQTKMVLIPEMVAQGLS